MRRLLLRLAIIIVLAIILLLVLRFSEVELEALPPATPSRTVVQVLPTEAIVSTPEPTVRPLPTQALPPTQTSESPLTVYPSGEIVFHAENLGIFRMAANGENINRLASLPGGASFPFLSSSGKRLGYFISQRFGDDIVNLIGVVEDGNVYQPTSRSAAQCLSSQPYLAEWSPDEQMVACVGILGSGKEATYFVAVTRFDSQAAPTYWSLWSSFQIYGLLEMSWTTDGRSLVFILDQMGQPRFYIAPMAMDPLSPGEEQPLYSMLPEQVAITAQALPGNRLLLASRDGIYLLAGENNNPSLITNRQAPYKAVSFNADGHYAATISAKDNSLYILDLASSTDRQVSDFPARNDPDFSRQTLTWSPDGKYLAFTLPNQKSTNMDDLFVMSRDGAVRFLMSLSSLQQRLQAPFPRVLWHPTDPYFLLQEKMEGRVTLFLVNPQGGDKGSAVARINPFQYVSLSQVHWLARQPVLEVVALPLALPPCQPLAARLELNNSAYSSLDPPMVSLLYREASYSSDAIGSLSPGETAWVLEGPSCNQNTNFWLLRAKRSGVVGWAAEASSTTYFLAPRPDVILYTSKGQVYALLLDKVISKDSTAQRQVADPLQLLPGLSVQFSSPRWLPFGDKFSFLATGSDISTALYVQDYITGNVLDLLSSLTLANPSLPVGAWSPDGSRVVVSLGAKGENRDLYMIQADGSQWQNLTGSPTLDDRSPAWSSDGTRLVYLSGEGKNTEIFVLAPGESITRLTSNQVEELSPFWSPSGDRIVFVELDGGDPYLYTMAPDGSEYTLLTAQRGWSPSWSPDGSQIAFTDAVTDRLFLIDVNASGGAVGGSLRVLALAGDDKYPVQPVWAPAGGQLAYVYQDTLYIYNLTTNQSIPMAYNLDNPFIAWQP